jgi:2',3'-cyclic-nucleotide 2'-phosphodiesterase (5'-nucleotidase family)
MHGNLYKGQYVGYTQLATLIKQERLHNPSRTLLLNSGDNIQGDGFSFFYKSSYTGKAVDGTVLPDALKTNPIMAVMNSMSYDAMTLGNHEFNFGSDVFKGVLGQAAFPVLQANVTDTGAYGLAAANGGAGVQSYVTKSVGPEGIKVAILGIGNHRVPNYELPSNIPGLTFPDPLSTAQAYADELGAGNDAVVALTHIGFTTNPKSVEVDNNVDTAMAATVTGLDVIVGGHSHTNPAAPEAPYKYLPTVAANPDGAPVLINHAYRYNNTLGEIFVGMRPTAQVLADHFARFYADGQFDNAGVYNSLQKKLTKALAKFEAGQTKAAANELGAFINELNAQAGKHISAAAAAALIADAQAVIDRPDGYSVVSRAGNYISVSSATAEDPAITAIVAPYAALLAAYNNTVIGQTTVPIDALQAYTQETNGANLQADAAVHELASNGVAVDVHLSGAMSNRKVPTDPAAVFPYTLKVSDMFTLMPYENSLVVMEMNGPQLEAVLERAYRNYYYFKYVTGYGGYSYYTTCMLDTDAGNVITYDDTPAAYDPAVDHVVSLSIGGVPVDFADAGTYYRVSTVNYLAAGSCNFNNGGISLWPLGQIVNDTQLYVRDAVIHYVQDMGTVSPAIEGRLVFE